MKAASLLSIVWIAFANADTFKCTVCEEGTRPEEPLAVLVVEGEIYTCAEAYNKGVFTVDLKEDCTYIKNIGKFSCKCSADAPPIETGCRLCQDDSKLSKPGFEPWPGRTCRELEIEATRNKACPVYQSAFGKYCGCENNKDRTGTCRLCGSGKFLPQPKRITSNDVSCMEREFLGTLSDTCTKARANYAAQCCDTTPIPSRKPSRKPTKTPTRKATRTPTRKATRTPTRKATRTPTRKTTRTPTRKSSQPPIASCFAGDMMLTEAGGKIVAMKDLKVGTYVQDSANSYSRVYSFGHHDNNANAKYLQIHTEGEMSPLEISVEHMVYSQASEPIAAGALQIGDSLRLGNGTLATITKIRIVTRAGVFAPFTDSGKVIVNGVLASSYIEVDHGVPLSKHWLAHLCQSPHRLCTRFGGCPESYNKEGLSIYVSALYSATKWWMKQNIFIRVGISFPSFILFFTVFALDSILLNPWIVTGLAVLASLACYRRVERLSLKR